MTLEIRVYGMVQGVGFRPFVAELAQSMGISGSVRNSGGIVHITASGTEGRLKEFCRRIEEEAPREAYIQKIKILPLSESSRKKNSSLEIIPKDSFSIIDSTREGDKIRLLPPDIATCPKCEQELLDPTNRRFRYPFISCTVCGPRFSILEDIPYDREHTTMKKFGLCQKCEAEYKLFGDRRHHSQTNACEVCGPKLRSYKASPDSRGTIEAEGEEALQDAIRVLKEGGIIALKNVGGFHFAFLPDALEAARRLREWKNRKKKPFAVMFESIDAIRKVCKVSQKEEELLTSQARPIVLLQQKNYELWPEVSSYSDRLGAMLPADPLQILLIEECGPLVMTSGNRGGEPIHIDGREFIEALPTGLPDLVLDHDREILTPLDDSIYQLVRIGEREEVQILRRARGLVPEPIWINRRVEEDTFAAGGDLKNSFALAREDAVYLSGHFGDLEWIPCRKAREKSIKNMTKLLGIKPQKSICDLHPAYFSSNDLRKEAEEAAKTDSKQKKLLEVQHHLAHIMSVIAEEKESPKITDVERDGDETIHLKFHIRDDERKVILGLAFDGTGYGTDGRVWGSEFLRVMMEGDTIVYKNLFHLHPVLQLGGDEGARDARRMAFSYLCDALDREMITREEWEEYAGSLYGDEADQVETLLKIYRSGVNQVRSSSMGRFFDAAAALLGIAYMNSYEGECPIALETYAHRIEDDAEKRRSYEMKMFTYGMEKQRVREDYLSEHPEEKQYKNILEENELDGTELLIRLLKMQKEEMFSREELALFFHRELVDMVGKAVRVQTFLADMVHPTIVLSGGSFLNRLLLGGLVEDLERGGFTVEFNHKVPAGDGGIALGQAYISSFKILEEV